MAYNSHMNIFYLDQDVEQAAADHCDKHVVKMIIISLVISGRSHGKLSHLQAFI